jgi:AcrR family transcriptional regulator
VRKKDQNTEKRIVEAAYYLFYRKGFTRVTVDEIAARTGITKRTLYAYYRSKDDLLAAALEHYNEVDLARLQVIAEQLPKRPSAMLDAFFNQIIAWSETPRWSGSGFTRVTLELADLPGHPARAVARRAKMVTEGWMANLLAEGKVLRSREHAREVMVLMEGAMVLMLMHGDASYARVAARAAKQLLKSSTRRKARLV